MKKRGIWALLLGAALLLSGCGEVSGSVSKPNDPSPATSGSVTASSGEDSSAVFEPGEMAGGVYTNEFLGVGCTLDSNWTYLTAEQIAKQNGLIAEQMTDEDLAQAIAENGNLQDMFAQAEDGLVTINVVIEDLGVLYGLTTTEEQYASLAQDQLDGALGDVGFTNIEMEVDTQTMAGAEHPALLITAEIEGVPVYERQIYIKKSSYIASFTFASYYEDITSDLVDLFYALEK